MNCLITFRPTTDIFPKKMRIEGNTLEECWTTAINTYGLSVEKVTDERDTQDNIEVVPFGTTVKYLWTDYSYIPNPKKRDKRFMNTRDDVLVYPVNKARFETELEPIQSILDWFETANVNKTLNKSVQYGCHLEEISEMSEIVTPELTPTMQVFSHQYKSGIRELPDLSENERIQLLDSLCDQIVTAVGTAYLLGMDILGALQEVCKSNNSKFEDGEAVFDANGKIAKGKDYVSPDLTDFV